jgi:hypothetical protein
LVKIKYVVTNISASVSLDFHAENTKKEKVKKEGSKTLSLALYKENLKKK